MLQSVPERGGVTMEKVQVVKLIKHYIEREDEAFRDEAYRIAFDFNRSGDSEFAEYIITLLSDDDIGLRPLPLDEGGEYLKKISTPTATLLLPGCILDELLEITDTVNRNAGTTMFLLQGPEGTGKSESVKQMARILNRPMFTVENHKILASTFEQTLDNIAALFSAIHNRLGEQNVVVHFDRLDQIIPWRIDNEAREHLKSVFFNGLTHLPNYVTVIATADHIEYFDDEWIAQFDKVVDFNRYMREDLQEIAERILEDVLKEFRIRGRNIRLFRKIIELMYPIPFPGELKRLIKASVAYSSPSHSLDYLRNFYSQAHPTIPRRIKTLHKNGFSISEIEILTNIPRSQVVQVLVKENE